MTASIRSGALTSGRCRWRETEYRSGRSEHVAHHGHPELEAEALTLPWAETFASGPFNSLGAQSSTDARRDWKADSPSGDDTIFVRGSQGHSVRSTANRQSIVS